MALPVVGYGDVEIRYLDGDLSELGTQSAIEEQILDVVDDVQVRWGAIVEFRLKSGLLTERTFTRVVSNVVLRVLRNPDGIYDETLGNYQYKMSRAVATGFITYLPEEIELLTGIGDNLNIGTINAPVAPLGGGTTWW